MSETSRMVESAHPEVRAPRSGVESATGPSRGAVVRALRILAAEVASMKAQKEAQEAERVGSPCPHLYRHKGQCQSCGQTPPTAGKKEQEA